MMLCTVSNTGYRYPLAYHLYVSMTLSWTLGRIESLYMEERMDRHIVCVVFTRRTGEIVSPSGSIIFP